MNHDQVPEPFRQLLNDFSREFVDDTRLEARDALRLIVETAEKYPDAMLPTPLLAAIQHGKSVL